MCDHRGRHSFGSNEEGSLQHARAQSSAALAILGLALAGLLSTWSGCASGGSTTTTSTGGSGGQSTTATGHGGSTVTTGSGGHAGNSVTCATDEKLCAGNCVKVDDPAFGCTPTSCDACQAPPNAAAACSGGQCTLGGCAAGFKNCDGDASNGCETNTDTDPDQCGACGSPCIVPHALATCVAGKCQVGTCENGSVDCDGDPTNGCEAIPQVDPKNCGACNTACPPTESCENGMCGLFCPKGKANCNNDESDGCETPLGTVGDCAFCGNNCDVANASSSCQNGACHLDTCDTGWANCDTQAANGCETNTQTDGGNCGSCGNICPSGPHSTAVCQNGGCVLNCDPGWADCDHNPNNGCEVHIDVDNGNCGSCGAVCNIANGTPSCVAGVCTVGGCNSGFSDCDLNPKNGCEVNTQTDPNNCSACGSHCTIPNGVAGCAGGMCTVGTCATGFTDCDGVVSNGCETNTGADPSNCGMCGKACQVPNATASCVNGSCGVAACNTGFTNCNNAPGDGCEVHTAVDPNNCGSCNRQCSVVNGSPSCNNGACSVATCTPPFADCNGLGSDGCEINTSNDPNNCGQCGYGCNAMCVGHVTATSCGGSACTVTGCAPGFFDVDGVCTNGCECQSSGTSMSCNTPSSLGTLQVGQSTNFTGNLVPTGTEAYIAVTFAGNTNGGYHPKVNMTVGTGEFAFDILSSCSGTRISCGVEGGNSTGITTWEEVYTAGDPNQPANFNPIPPVGANGTVIIHVYRRPGKQLSCSNYMLVVSN
jgi:hypothetical protein